MNTVEKRFCCPECGENRVDYLENLEDGLVYCLSCETTYSLETGEPVVSEDGPDFDSRREDYYEAGLYPPFPLKGGQNATI